MKIRGKGSRTHKRAVGRIKARQANRRRRKIRRK